MLRKVLQHGKQGNAIDFSNKLCKLNKIFKEQGTNAWYELSPEELLKGYNVVTIMIETGASMMVNETLTPNLYNPCNTS